MRVQKSDNAFKLPSLYKQWINQIHQEEPSLKREEEKKSENMCPHTK